MSDGHEMTERHAATEENALAPRLSSEELAREGGELLPDKEVLSILDLFVNIDLALNLAAPIDLAVAANANVAAPIDAAASANVLSFASASAAVAQQQTLIDQHISGEAIATADQDATLDQTDDIVGGGDTGGTGGTGGDTGGTAGTGGDTGGTGGESTGTGSGDTTAVEQPASQGTNVSGDGASTQVTENLDANGILEGPLLNVNVDASIDADLASPVAGAVAANANVAAPIDAAVSANIGTIASQSTAVADQTAIVNQELEGVTAEATADQTAEVTQ
jgi:hypothetical protein